MQTPAPKAAVCKSVFKSTSAQELSRAFNQKWVELINRLERLSGASRAGQERRR